MESDNCVKTDSDSSSVDSGPVAVTQDMIKIGLSKQGEPVTKLLNEFRDVVALSGESLGRTNLIEHHINLKPGISPIYVPAYRLPHSQRETVSKLVEDMMQQGVIEPSVSPWNFPLILVPKKKMVLGDQ